MPKLNTYSARITTASKQTGRAPLWIIVVFGLIATLAIVGMSLLGIKLSF